MRSRWVRASVGCAIGVLSAVLAVAWFNWEMSAKPPDVRVELVSPNDNGVVISKPLINTDLEFRVTNVSVQTIRRLAIEPGCGIQVLSSYPTILRPGQAFEALVRFRSPPRGRGLFRLPVYAENASGPIAALQVELEVPVNPPLLVRALSDLHVTVVEGDPGPPIWRITTLERRADPYWVKGVRCGACEVGDVVLTESAEEADFDPRYCHRTYTLELRNITNLGSAESVLALDVDENLAPPPPAIACRLSRLPRIGVFPSEAVLAGSRGRLLLSVVDRLGLEEVRVRADRPHDIRVARVDGDAALFEITSRDDPLPSDLGNIVVECNGATPLLLPIRREGLR